MASAAIILIKHDFVSLNKDITIKWNAKKIFVSTGRNFGGGGVKGAKATLPQYFYT
jgi:hypothetical protein